MIMNTESENEQKCPWPNLGASQWLCKGTEGDCITLAHRFCSRDMKTTPSTFRYWVLQIESVWVFFCQLRFWLVITGAIKGRRTVGTGRV